ncbi:MAG: hypothetical protein MI919_15375 [Holophagales bacterium]|nr:hypothetical protein [Holophagales bacterium]
MARDIRPGTVYELAHTPEALPAGLELHYLEWAVLFAVTGRHTVAQIARAFELEPGERDSVFARLQEAGVLRERSLTYPEYLRASGTLQPGGAPVDLRRFLCAGITLGEAGAPEAATADGEAPTSDPPATRIDAPPASGPPSTPGIPTAGPPSTPGSPTPGQEGLGLQGGSLPQSEPAFRTHTTMPEKETSTELEWGTRIPQTKPIRPAFDQDLQQTKAYRAMLKQVEDFIEAGEMLKRFKPKRSQM